MTATKPAHPVEEWTAAGTRILSNGRRAQAFRDPNGKILYYAMSRSYVVGSRYTFEVERPPGTVTRYGHGTYAGRSDLGDEVAQWEIESEAAERTLRAAAAEKRDKRAGGVLDEACKPICEVAAKLRDYEDVERLVTSVRRRIYDAWDKGGK